jgi:hypothetical protein
LYNNLAKQGNNWEKYNEEMAFLIFLVEKEFNVGPILPTFPLLKFFNLVDEYNHKRYQKMISGKGKTGTWSAR